MKNLPYFNVSSQQVTTHGCIVKKIAGGYRDATSLWLQVHDSATVPAEGAAPIKSWPLSGGSDADPVPFQQTFIEPLEIVNGLYICLSTTDATKTLSTDKTDLDVEIERTENSTTVVGDNTTGVTGLEVWNEASGATARKKLVSLRVDGTGLTAAAYIMLFAKDSPTEGDKPVRQWPLAKNETKVLNFGENGREVFSKDSAERIGCTVKISSTTNVLTTITAQTCTIKAEYKIA